MKPAALFCVLAVSSLLLSSCGTRTPSFREMVQRGELRQASIRIDEAPNGVEADRMLMRRQGYMTAFDRFPQMEVLRRTVQGSLSEVFYGTTTKGEAPLDSDRQSIALGMPWGIENADARIAKEHPEIYDRLIDFAGGVNDFIRRIETERPEFLRIFRKFNPHYLPALWKPADSLAIILGMTFYLSNQLKEKMVLTLLGRLAYRGEPEKLFSRVVTNPIENVFIAPRRGLKFLSQAVGNGFLGHFVPPHTLEAIAKFCKTSGFPNHECFPPSPMGSNNWVISPKFNGGDTTYLANDPHLPVPAPYPMFVEVALDSKGAGGTFRGAGMSIVGSPGITIGHNENLAFGVTNLGADVDDLRIARLNEDGTKVKIKGEWVELEKRVYHRDVLSPNGEVKNGGEDIVLRIVPGFGTLVSDGVPEAALLLSTYGEKNLALAYEHVFQRGTREMVAGMKLNRASTIEEAREAWKYFESGAQNFVVADRDGNISYFGHGLYPVRRYLSRKRPPGMVLDTMDGTGWDGFRTEVPSLVNPDEGFIVTANNDPWGHTATAEFSDLKDYFGMISFNDGIRASRIRQMILERKGSIDVEAIRTMQTDHYDLLAVRFAALMKQALPNLQLTPEAQTFGERVVKWASEDARTEADKEEPVLFYAWVKSLIRSEFADLLKGPAGVESLADQFVFSNVTVKTTYHHLKTQLASKDADERAKGEARVKATILAGMKRMEEEKTVGKLYGDTNRVEFASTLPGILPVFKLMNWARSGGPETVDVSYKSHAPNFRLIMELRPGRPIRAYRSIPLGNWGLENMDGMYDETRRWLDGQLSPLIRF